jgi:hypothetical protein
MFSRSNHKQEGTNFPIFFRLCDFAPFLLRMKEPFAPDFIANRDSQIKELKEINKIETEEQHKSWSLLGNIR